MIFKVLYLIYKNGKGPIQAKMSVYAVLFVSVEKHDIYVDFLSNDTKDVVLFSSFLDANEEALYQAGDNAVEVSREGPKPFYSSSCVPVYQSQDGSYYTAIVSFETQEMNDENFLVGVISHPMKFHFSFEFLPTIFTEKQADEIAREEVERFLPRYKSAELLEPAEREYTFFHSKFLEKTFWSPDTEAQSVVVRISR